MLPSFSCYIHIAKPRHVLNISIPCCWCGIVPWSWLGWAFGLLCGKWEYTHNTPFVVGEWQIYSTEMNLFAASGVCCSLSDGAYAERIPNGNGPIIFIYHIHIRTYLLRLVSHVSRFRVLRSNRYQIIVILLLEIYIRLEYRHSLLCLLRVACLIHSTYIPI